MRSVHNKTLVRHLLDRANAGEPLPQVAGGAGLESNILGLWVAKQTGKGSPASMIAGTKRPRWVGGDLQVNRADGTEQFSDGTLFGDTVDFVNTLIGNGAPVLQGQSGILGYLNWLACGQETVTPGANDVQTIPASTATGGTFTISMNGYVTAPIAYNATNAVVQAAILAATNAAGKTLPAGSVTVTGGPVNTGATVVTFTGPLGNQPVPLLVLNTAGLTGGSIGAVTHTTNGSGSTHVATPSDNGGFWSTWVKSVGKNVQYIAQFNDCRIASLRWEGSSASKVVKITPTFVSLDPGQLLTVNPTKVDDGSKPLIYTEGAGSFSIDGALFHGHSAFAAEAQWGLQEWYGEGVAPYDLVNLRADLILQGITILLDAQGMQEYNNIVYGVPNPAANAKPIAAIPALGSYSCTFSRVNPYTGLVSESFQFQAPSVKWDPGLAIPASVAGGPVELPLAGEYRKVAGQPAFTLTTVNADAAYSS